jgi:serine protease Do
VETSIPLTVARGTGEEQIDLYLADLGTEKITLEDRCWQEVGVRLSPVSSDRVQKVQSRYRGGLVVEAVRDDGPAADQGIRKGDILVGLHVWETISPENVTFVLDKSQEENIGPLKFYVLRGRETLFGHLTRDTIRR